MLHQDSAFNQMLCCCIGPGEAQGVPWWPSGTPCSTGSYLCTGVYMLLAWQISAGSVSGLHQKCCST